MLTLTTACEFTTARCAVDAWLTKREGRGAIALQGKYYTVDRDELDGLEQAGVPFYHLGLAARAGRAELVSIPVNQP